MNDRIMWIGRKFSIRTNTHHSSLNTIKLKRGEIQKWDQQSTINNLKRTTNKQTSKQANQSLIKETDEWNGKHIVQFEEKIHPSKLCVDCNGYIIISWFVFIRTMAIHANVSLIWIIVWKLTIISLSQWRYSLQTIYNFIFFQSIHLFLLTLFSSQFVHRKCHVSSLWKLQSIFSHSKLSFGVCIGLM